MQHELVTKTYPAAWASAIINMEYTGLITEDRHELNKALLNDDMSFNDCVQVGDNYTGSFNGLTRDVADYTFRVKKQ